MRLRLPLVATLVVAVILIFALYRKGDVKAAFKTPLIEFSIDAKERPPVK
jgi:hypothetical protein